MSEPVSVARQATFNTEPADSDTASGNSIRSGNILIPVVEETPVEETDPRRLSLVSSGRSSPIYANGDPEIKKYRTSAFNSRPPLSTRPPSSYGDSSELEILSDVGLAGDSDTDVPPKLSLSARKKIRKEPRIKVPSAKFDAGEPTIEEETTQDVLTALAPVVSETDTDAVPQVTTAGIRSDTVVVDSPRKRKSVSFNLTSDISDESGSGELQQEPLRTLEASPKHLEGSPPVTDSTYKVVARSPRRGVNSTPPQKRAIKTNQKPKAGRLSSPINSLQPDDPEILDSSFCESDWQPKNPKTNGITKSPRVHAKDTKCEPKEDKTEDRENNARSRVENGNVGNQDQLEIPRNAKLARDKKLVVSGSTQNDAYPNTDNGQSSHLVEADKKIISDKYETDLKPTHTARLDFGKRWAPRASADTSKEAERSVSGQPAKIQQNTDNLTNANNNKHAGLELQHTSASLSHAQTPVISNFIDGDAGTETDASAISDWNNEGVSGIPKQGRLSKESKTSDRARQTTAESTKPLSSLPTTPRMATSDGYDYESETFEEVLKERNAMVKAERAYQRRIKQLEEELKGMVNECQLLSDENKELRKNLESMKTSKENTVVSQKPDSVDLASRIARLETEKEILSNSNEKLTAKLKDNEVKMKQWDSVFVENTKLKSKNAELERKVHRLEKEVDSLSNPAKESDTEMENRMHHSDAKSQELHSQMNELKQENKTLLAEVKALENNNESLSTALEDKRTELSELMRAMQTETATESELKDSKAKLDRAQEEVDSVKQELEDMKKMLKDSEESKAKLQGHLAQKDSDIKRMKVNVDNKDNVISDLRKTVDKGKQEIQRLEEEQQGHKDMEKEALALKSRIGSLKAEIESSLTENQRLKMDREEMTQLIERLRQENAQSADAAIESRKYFRKWENERETRNKAEVEMAKKEEEVQILDARLKETGNKLNVLHSRVRILEDEKAQIGSANIQELQTSNTIMKDENKKLRQMLVERNIELTNKKSEQTVIDTRIQVLERKQKDAEVRVWQLSGWVSNMEGSDRQPDTVDTLMNNSNKGNRPPRPPNNSQSRNMPKAHNEQRPPLRDHGDKSLKVVEPKVAYISPRTHIKGRHRGAQSARTPPPGWEEESKRRFEGDGLNHTPLSLPLILDTKSMTPPDPHGGYFMLYKEKLKRMKDRKF